MANEHLKKWIANQNEKPKTIMIGTVLDTSNNQQKIHGAKGGSKEDDVFKKSDNIV